MYVKITWSIRSSDSSNTGGTVPSTGTAVGRPWDGGSSPDSVLKTGNACVVLETRRMTKLIKTYDLGGAGEPLADKMRGPAAAVALPPLRPLAHRRRVR